MIRVINTKYREARLKGCSNLTFLAYGAERFGFTIFSSVKGDRTMIASQTDLDD